MLEALLEAALRSLVLTAVVWAGLWALRPHNPRLQLAAWTLVLAASLAMPVASRLAAAIFPPAPLIAPGLDLIFPKAFNAPKSFDAALPPRPGATAPPTAVAATSTTVESPMANGRTFALLVYAIIAGALLARLAAGLFMTIRIVRWATPLREAWTAGHDIRVSPDVAAPATFGSIVLLPEAYVAWSPPKRAAVLAHETAHVRRGDFYVQIAATAHRAIFWFSPMSWWLRRRLSELAEAASDDDAIGDLRDRPLYAQILLEVSHGSPLPPGGVAMARPATLRARIERILDDSVPPAPVGERARLLLVAAVLAVAALAASPITARSAGPTTDESLSAEPQQGPHVRIAIDAKRLDADAGFYEDMASGVVMTVLREDDHLVTSRTGKARVAEYPYSEHDFFMTVAAEQDAFIADASGDIVRVIHRKNGLATVFERIAPDAAAQVETDFERRVAEELTPRVPVNVDAATLDGYVGYYQLTPTFIFAVTREGDQLFVQATGQKKYAVYPYSDHDFFYTVVAAQLTFADAASGLILHQDGKDRTAKRVSAEAALAFQQRLDDQLKPRTAVAIDPGLLDRYVGRYSGPTISMMVTREADRLYVQVLGYNKYRVYPYTERDFFATTLPAQVSFVADSQSRIVQLIRREHGQDLVLDRIE